MRNSNIQRDKKRALRVSQKLSDLFDGIDDPVYVSDPKKHKILFFNNRAKEVFCGDMDGKKCFEIIQGLKHPCPFCTNKYILGGNIGRTHIWESQNRRNGRWYKCIDKAIQWTDARYVRLEIAIDITAYKELASELESSNRQLQALINAIPDIVFFKDKQGRNMITNKAFEEFVGLDRKEILGKTDRQLLPTDLAMQCYESDREVLDRKQCLRFEERTEHDGDVRYFETIKSPVYDERGGISGIVGVGREVTERKKTQEIIQRKEERFRSIVENSHDGIGIIGDDFKVIYVNDEVARITGYAKKELIGKDFREFLKGGDRSIERIYLSRRKGEKTPNGYEYTVTTKDGRKRIVEVRSTILRDRQGSMQTIAQVLDVTSRKEAERARRQFESRLATLNEYGQNLARARDTKEVLRLTLGAMEKTLGFELADIFFLDGRKLSLVAHGGHSSIQDMALSIHGPKGIVAKAARLCIPVLIPDVRVETAYIESGIEGILSELAVPIKLRNRLLGVLNVESKKLNAFNEDDVRLLETLASHTAIALSNLRRQSKLSALNVYGRSLNRARSKEAIHRLTLKAMKKILGFEYASILVKQGEKLVLAIQHGYSSQLSLKLTLNSTRGVTVRAVKTGAPVLVRDIRKERAYVVGKPGMLSELAMPIKAGKEIFGVLNVESERVDAFDEDDIRLLETLASHTAIALSNLRRHDQLKMISGRMKYLMKSITRIMHIKTSEKRLDVIVKAIRKLGWRRVVISLRDDDLEGTTLVTAGLEDEEIRTLIERKAPGRIWRERLGPRFERFKIGEFYYLPWSDPWVREKVHGVPPEVSPSKATTYAGVPSKLSAREMVDWHPQDMLYAPLRTPEGRIVGTLSMDDPATGRKPDRESLAPLELFLHQAAIIIENAQLLESLKEAQVKLEAHAQVLEEEIEHRTLELRRSQEELLKTQRLAVIGELAGMVGHDLRNPLTSINGAAYYLRRKLGPGTSPEAEEMLDLIERNINYSNKIISDLLDYSGEVKLDLSGANPKSIVAETLSLIEIPKTIRLDNSAGKTPTVTVDVQKLKRALVNIVKNAIEAMPQGGVLTIKSRTLRGHLSLSISDTGVGMAKKVLDQIWKPLFTTKARGMGFGLAISKRIIEAHRGMISVDSSPGEGTTFTVTIPIIEKRDYGGEKVWVRTPESSLLTTTRT